MEEKQEGKKYLFFVVSGKASVGKSLFTRGMVEVMRKHADKHGHLVGAVDADPANNDLKRYFDPKKGIFNGCWAIDGNKEMEVVNTMDKFDKECKGNQYIFVDFRGANYNALCKYAPAIISRLKVTNVELSIINIIDNTLPSAMSVMELCGAYKNSVRHLILKSARVDPDSFYFFEHDMSKYDFSKKLPKSPRQEVLNNGGEIYDLPRIDDESAVLFLDVSDKLLFDPVFDDEEARQNDEYRPDSLVTVMIAMYRDMFASMIVPLVITPPKAK